MPPAVSIVIPVYNEEENLPPLLEQVHGALGGIDYEVILVDDGSQDRSFEIIRAGVRADRRVRAVRLRTNSGQTAALSAGFAAARGEIIAPLDADLQNDPADIPRLLEILGQGYDVVSGWRRDRHDDRWTRVIPSRVANRLISRISGVRLHDYGCTLKVYRRDILKRLRLFGEMHRFIPIYAAREGARVTEAPVTHHPRRHGRSKYGPGRTLKVLLDLLTIQFLTSYATKPIYIFGGIGAVLCGLGFAVAGITLLQKIFLSAWVHRNPLALLAVFLVLVGMQLVMMGVLAELIVRIWHETQRRPGYTVSETIGVPGEAEDCGPAA